MSADFVIVLMWLLILLHESMMMGEVFYISSFQIEAQQLPLTFLPWLQKPIISGFTLFNMKKIQTHPVTDLFDPVSNVKKKVGLQMGNRLKEKLLTPEKDLLCARNPQWEKPFFK